MSSAARPGSVRSLIRRTVALDRGAREAGVSLGGRLALGGISLLNIKSSFLSVGSLRKRIGTARKRGPAVPSRRLRRTMVVRDDEIDGCAVYTVEPRDRAPRATIVYLHGGAWVFSITRPHWWIIATLARRTGARIVVPLYPLAPEQGWQETFAFVDRVVERFARVEASLPYFLAGDSAGGHIALLTAQRAKDDGGRPAAGLVLFSPALDLTFENPDIDAIDPLDPMLARPGGMEAARWWAKNLSLDDPRISPLFGSLDGLPPVFTVSSTYDGLNPDALRLHEQLTANGTRSILLNQPAMFHVFMAVPMREGRAALEQAAAFVDRQIAEWDSS